MIHLIDMPFGSIFRPSLALGLIKSSLDQAGINSRVFHLNLLFAQRMGFANYETIALFKGVETQVSEWLFAEQAWGRSFGPDEEKFLALCGDELGGLPQCDDPSEWLSALRRDDVPLFLDDCIKQLTSQAPIKVAAFSCTFFQTNASLALARRLKEKFPDVKIVFGGACFHDEMGIEIFRNAPFIDVMSTGEADDIVVPLFEALLEKREPRWLQGLIYRTAENQIVESMPAEPVAAQIIDELPDAEFDDYFADAELVGLAHDRHWQARVNLPFESSRGCWWGQKKHCTFCGLNAQGMNFRAKSAERVLNTIDTYIERYPGYRYQATDNILNMAYFKDLIPQLSEKRRTGAFFELFYEVKANMTRTHIKALADAGVKYVQPGLESLSSRLLSIMGKGVTALQNVYFLKCCREYDIVAFWNILIRVPGEKREDYDQMVEWISALSHLRPPYGGAPKIELHRFSPYFSEKNRWTENVTPMRWYEGVFPADIVSMERVAYYFDADWKDTLEDNAYVELVDATHNWIQQWSERDRLPRLVMHPCGTGLEIEDTRTQGNELRVLDAEQSILYKAIDAPTKPQKVKRTLEDTAFACLTVQQIEAHLDRFVDAGLALTENGAYLAIAVNDKTYDPLLQERRQVFHEVHNQ